MDRYVAVVQSWVTRHNALWLHAAAGWQWVYLKQLCHQKRCVFFITWCYIFSNHGRLIWSCIIHCLPWLHNCTNQEHLQGTCCSSNECRQALGRTVNFISFLPVGTRWTQDMCYLLQSSSDAESSAAHEFTSTCFLIIIGINELWLLFQIYRWLFQSCGSVNDAHVTLAPYFWNLS